MQMELAFCGGEGGNLFVGSMGKKQAVGGPVL